MTAARQTAPIQFRDSEVERELRRRIGKHSAGLVAARDLERYYAILARARARFDLTEAEASLICDALNGILLDSTTIEFVGEDVIDAMRHDDLAAKWEVDGPELVKKLRALDPAGRVALADAVERFWIDSASGSDVRSVIRRVGLID